MHPEVTNAGPGKCPKCGMALVPATAATPVDVLVTTTPATPKAGEKTRVVFEMKSAGERLASFDIVHEKLLHLLMVTPDLAWFSHEHPDALQDGTFALDFTFPAGGTYRLFADFKPVGRAGSVIPVDVVVEGAPMSAQPLTPSDLSQPRTVGDFNVRFTSQRPVSGAYRSLSFLITQDDKPVANLEPYLGAMGHLVVIGDDGKTFLHAHPEDHAPEGHAHDAKDAGVHGHGPEGVVAFATKFPHAGRYKAWMQFQVQGKVQTADFTFDVAHGAEAPAGGHGGHGGADHAH